jgi:hypothetical protein
MPGALVSLLLLAGCSKSDKATTTQTTATTTERIIRSDEPSPLSVPPDVASRLFLPSLPVASTFTSKVANGVQTTLTYKTTSLADDVQLIREGMTDDGIKIAKRNIAAPAADLSFTGSKKGVDVSVFANQGNSSPDQTITILVTTIG